MMSHQAIATGEAWLEAEYNGKTQLVLVVDGREVGEICFISREAGGFEVSNLIVWSVFRRNGYATRLYERACEVARSKGGALYISSDLTADARALHSAFAKRGLLSADGRLTFQTDADKDAQCQS